MNAHAAAGAVLVIAAAAGCWVFVILYWRWFPWWRSETGIHLFAFVACLGVLDTLFAVSVFVRAPWLQLALLAAFTPEPFIVWWRVSLLVRTRRAHRGEEEVTPGPR